MKKTTTYIKLLSISILLVLIACDEKNDPVQVVDKKDTVIVEECLEREKNHFGLVYRPALIQGLVKSGDELFFLAGGRIHRYSLTNKHFEVIELNFDTKFDHTYIIQDFDMCPYDSDQMVIYATMYAPGLERAHQVITYNWKEKTGKIEEIEGFEDVTGIIYFTGLTWLVKSSKVDNYIFFSPGSFIDNNIIYNLNEDTFELVSNDLYFLESNKKQELRFIVENGERFRMELDGNFFGYEMPNGAGFGTVNNNFGYYAVPVSNHQKPIIEIYEFNNYHIGDKITEIDIFEEYCLHAQGTSLLFLDEDHLIFSALKEQSKFEGNRNIFDLYVYNFKTETLVDTIIFRQ
jgi:hypothetical protein